MDGTIGPTLDMSMWRGRVDDADGPRAVRWHQQVQPLTPESQPGVALLGFTCDEGVRRNQGRIGAAAGPRALRRALVNLAWHQEFAVYEAGDVNCPGTNLETAQVELARAVSAVLAGGHRALVFGGGHETALGTYVGIERAVPRDVTIGVINLDAHFDLRGGGRATSGTPFTQIALWCEENNHPFRYLCLGVAEPANTAALFDRARELGAEWRLDTDLTPGKLDESLAVVEAFAGSVDLLHLSIDLDVLPAAVMPAVSAPAARGVPLDVVEAVVAAVQRTGKVAAVDIVELNPAYDVDDQGARVAARLAWLVARGWT
ncbi:MAG: formimidoylglutamase [Gemmataceae bacterium]|nr:formimidoylglutamase [Gemmataceae bacterium]